MSKKKQKTVPVERPFENWTKFPNCILDNLEQFSHVELKILCLMVRKNIGYDNPNKMFSISYLCKKLGHNRTSVAKSINGLVEKQSIKVLKTGARGIRFFDINWIKPKKLRCTKKQHDRCTENKHLESRCTEKPLVPKSHQYQNGTSTGTKIVPDLVPKNAPLQERQIIKKHDYENDSENRNVSSFKNSLVSSVGAGQKRKTNALGRSSSYFPNHISITPERQKEITELETLHSLEYLRAQINYTIRRSKKPGSWFPFYLGACRENYAKFDEEPKNEAGGNGGKPAKGQRFLKQKEFKPEDCFPEGTVLWLKNAQGPSYVDENGYCKLPPGWGDADPNMIRKLMDEGYLSIYEEIMED